MRQGVYHTAYFAVVCGDCVLHVGRLCVKDLFYFAHYAIGGGCVPCVAVMYADGGVKYIFIHFVHAIGGLMLRVQYCVVLAALIIQVI